MVEVNAGHRRPTAVVVARERSTSWRPGRSSADDVPPRPWCSAPGSPTPQLMSGRLAERSARPGPGGPDGRVTPDPQRRHHRRQPGHRLAGRRHAAGAGRPRRRRSTCVSSSGERTLPLAEFVIGPKRTARRSDELIAVGPRPGARRSPGVPQGRHPQRHGDRRGLRWPRSSIGRPGRSAWRSARSGRPRSAPATPRRGWPTASTGSGDRPRPDPARRARPARRGAARPIDDHRSTADYRRHAVGVLAVRPSGACGRRPAGGPCHVRRPVVTERVDDGVPARSRSSIPAPDIAST